LATSSPLLLLSGGELVAKGLVKKLFENRKSLKAIPIPKTLQILKFGRGFHTGASFPMRKSPSNFESDIYGRPYGLDRVHIVDSSAFLSIPATTITLTLMANAHRIALDSTNLE
jgi:choline dehydrogenase-like flavoprotein